MYLLDMMSFREIVVKLVGELSPSMYFLYDILAIVLAFLFFLVVVSFIGFTLKWLKRW